MGQFHCRPAVILLAEDDPGDQELTRRALEEGKVKNELHVVQDGEEALDYLYRRGNYQDPTSSPHPDLVLLDLNMPKIDGRQVLGTIKSDPTLQRTAVVVLTTSKEDEDVIKTYQLGANSFISKPVDLDQFNRVVLSLEEYWFQVVILPTNGEPR